MGPYLRNPPSRKIRSTWLPALFTDVCLLLSETLLDLQAVFFGEISHAGKSVLPAGKAGRKMREQLVGDLVKRGLGVHP